jgi:hypothetical protein
VFPLFTIYYMGSQSQTRATRLPPHVDERFLEYRDKHDMSNSEALRELVRAGLEVEEGDDTAAAGGGGSGGVFGRIFPSLAGVAIVATLVLATTGATLAWPVPATAIVATVALVGHADEKLDRFISSWWSGARERIDEHGGGLTGVLKAAWATSKEEHPAPSDPHGIVERLAWADLYGHVFLIIGGVLSLPLYVVSPPTWFDFLGVSGLLAYIGLVVLLFYLWAATTVVGSLAQIALATAAEPGGEDTPAVEEAET